jgi:hypothetical protein
LVALGSGARLKLYFNLYTDTRHRKTEEMVYCPDALSGSQR